MKSMIVAASLLASAGSAAAQSEITRAGSQPAAIGSAENFVGTVMVEPVFGATDERNFSMGKVTFLPGARSNWHSHPKGQTLVVISGTGWTQAEDEERQTINAGDVVWCPPGVRHWHGATATTGMSHYAIQEREGDQVVTWQESVEDSQYLSQ